MRRVDRHARRLGVDDGIESAAESHVDRNLPAAHRHHQRRFEHERSDVAKGD
jgi:hypothetical protein